MRYAIFAIFLLLVAADLRAQEAAPADTIALDLTTTLDGVRTVIVRAPKLVNVVPA